MKAKPRIIWSPIYAKAAFEGAKDAAGYVASLSAPPPEEKPE